MSVLETITIEVGHEDDLPQVIALDTKATQLYRDAGLVIELDDAHPFTVEERARWAACARNEGLLLARDVRGAAVGFAAIGRVDGAWYLDQLSVDPRVGRRGIGRGLLRTVLARAEYAGAPAVWLTTYVHIPWNAPFYRAEGFTLVDEGAWGPELREIIAAQRRDLPAPQHRVAMRYALT